MPLPDYQGGSIVNLMASLIAGRGGGTTPYPQTPLLTAREIEAYRTVVLMVVDGLGDEMLARAAPPGPLRALYRGRLSSVFPSTTAMAISAFLTGLGPQQHGVTGWFTHFEEIGGVTTVLPFIDRVRGSSLSAAGIDAGRLLGHTPVFDLMHTGAYTVIPERIAGSPFNRAHTGRAVVRTFRSLNQCLEAILALARAGSGPQYIYAYWPELDQLTHRRGVASQIVARHIVELDGALGALLERLPDSTMVVLTADHGLTDCRPGNRVELSAHPALAQTLRLPLCGEQRVAYCYVKEGRAEAFRRYVTAHLEGHAELHRSIDLVTDGYFGLGPRHPRLLERVGDYTLIMRPGHTIKDWLPNERHFRHLGFHGGLTTAEMYVPLIVYGT